MSFKDLSQGDSKPLSKKAKRLWMKAAKPLLALTKEQKEDMWKDCYVKCERPK